MAISVDTQTLLDYERSRNLSVSSTHVIASVWHGAGRGAPISDGTTQKAAQAIRPNAANVGRIGESKTPSAVEARCEEVTIFPRAENVSQSEPSSLGAIVYHAADVHGRRSITKKLAPTDSVTSTLYQLLTSLTIVSRS